MFSLEKRLQLPTGSDDLLAADKWGVGPTFVVLKQAGPRTLGTLFNHIESVAGNDRRQDVHRKIDRKP